MSDPIIFEKRVASGADDVEQRAASMSLTSSDLELVNDGTTSQRVGLRFTGIDIPQGAVITAAYLQFTTDEVGSAATSLLIRGEDVNDAAAFATTANNLSARALTDASAAWNPAAWTTVGQAGLAQRSTDLSAVVQEIVARPGWLAGNDMAFVVTGTGTRTADAFEDNAATAPLLHIEYTLAGGSNAAPTLDLNGAAAGTGYATTFAENGGGVAIAGVDAVIADADDTNMESLTAALANPQAGDQLVVNSGGLPSGITVSSASTATNLILVGSATTAAYQTALRQISFTNTGETPAPTSRTINVTVSDGTANSNTAVATVAIDRAPDAADDATATAANTAVTTGNVLANDDPGDGPATVTAFDNVSARGGTVVSNGNGTFTYTPAAGFTGADSFTYRITDIDGDISAAATVAVTVASNASITFEKRIVSGADDVEQAASGSMSLTSSDLELVNDGSNNQRVGLRFTGIDIPQGAVITAAYLQFTTDEVGSAATSLLIRGEDVNDAAAFATTANNLSARALTDASAAWNPAAWTTVGQAGLAQRSTDLSAVVQEIVARPGWLAGNDMAFVVTGTGTRTADAFEDNAATAPLLHIEYTLAGGSNAAPTLDLNGAAAGTGYATTFAENGGGVAIAGVDAVIADADDTNMESLTAALANPQAGDQLVVNSGGLPSGITVSSASTATNLILVGSATTAAYQTALRQISFTNTGETPAPTSRTINVTVSDGTANSNTAVATVAIDRAPDAADDATATAANTAVTTGNVLANDDPGDGPATVTAFDNVSARGGTVVSNGNGTFTYTPAAGFTGADSFTYRITDIDGDISAAATVAVTVASNASITFEKRIVSGADDVEQAASGSMSLTSSDLELVNDGSNNQRVGLRFTGIDIPQGAVITAAYLQFTTDEVGSAATSLLIRGEDVNDAAAFATTANNLSARALTDASAAWNPAAWTTVGQAGLAQRSTDLSAVVQEIVARPGWLAGNDMAFVVTGTGTRTADAFEDNAATAPLLHIEYALSGQTVLVADGTPNPQSETNGAKITFAVTLTSAATEDVILTYSTVNGTAAAGSDFVGVSNGQATIRAGSTSVTIPIDLLNDTIAENAEAFTLRLDSARLAATGTPLTIADATGTGTIAPNDGAPSQPRVVATRDIRESGSTDPSGLAYIPDTQTFYLSDSEVDETPFFRSDNLFALRTDGTPVDSLSILNFTDEPTGLAFDPTTGDVFISDDDQFLIFRVDPDNPTVKRGEFDAEPVGATDPEDLAVNPDDGHLFIVNGLPRTIVETTNAGAFVSRISLPSVIEDPEALAYDPNQDVFYIGGGFSDRIWRVDRSGNILETINVLDGYRNPLNNARVKVKDLELAPSSNPNDAPSKLNLYVADFGEQLRDDGRLIEIDLFL